MAPMVEVIAILSSLTTGLRRLPTRDSVPMHYPKWARASRPSWAHSAWRGVTADNVSFSSRQKVGYAERFRADIRSAVDATRQDGWRCGVKQSRGEPKIAWLRKLHN